MTLNSIIFIDNLPKLDLHGLDREEAKFYLEEFINDNLKLKQEIIVIVHGIGQGVLKETTHQHLKRNKNIIDFKTFYYNHSCTIVQLKLLKNSYK